MASRLGVPFGWWHGSNFTTDLKNLPPNLVVKVESGKRSARLKLTKEGVRYVRTILNNE